MRTLIYGFCVICTACLPVLGVDVDQSQLQYDGINDWSDGVYQTFTAGTSSLLRAVSLLVDRNGGPRDLTINIRRAATNGLIGGSTIATGTLPGSEMDEGVSKWYTIDLDTPYLQTNGEALAFQVEYGPAGSPYGWLELGHATNNPYTNGLFYYDGVYGTLGAYDVAHLDLAFETLVSPGIAASFSATNAVGIVPLEVVFTASVMSTNSPEALFFSWDIDDDGSPDGEGLGLIVFTNTYTVAGVYSVKLTVTNGEDEVTVLQNAAVGAADPADIYVSRTGSNTHPYDSLLTAATNIQTAIDAASDGESILVADGIYSGYGNCNIDFRGKKVQLRSIQGPLKTIIDGAGSGPGFVFHSGENTNSVLSGFTVQNCGVLDQSREPYEVVDAFSACVCLSNSSPRIYDCRFLNNHAARGGGVYIEDSSPVIDSCVISSNFAGYGGGIYCQGGEPLITNSVLSNARSYLNVSLPPVTLYGIEGGGIYICSNASVCVMGSTLSDNSGGGIVSSNASATIHGTYITDNFPGGQRTFIVASPVTIDNQSGAGGGVQLYSSSVTITDSVIADNRAGKGAAVCCSEASMLTIENSIVSNNDAAASSTLIQITAPPVQTVDLVLENSSGAVYLENSTGYISQCTFIDNLAGRGGAIAAHSNSLAVVTNAAFMRNRATESFSVTTIGISAPPVYILDVTTDATGRGGALYTSESRMMVSDCIFDGNVAGSGGGAAITGGSTQQMWNCIFTNNSARDYVAVSNDMNWTVGGGAVFVNESDLVAENCNFLANDSGAMSINTTTISNDVLVVVDEQRTIKGVGGAMLFLGSDVQMLGCRLLGNATGYEGGAAYIASNSAVSMSGCLVEGSTCEQHATNITAFGGGLSVSGAALDLVGCIVTGGRSPDNGGGVSAVSNSTLNLYSTTISGNAADRAGDCLYIDGSTAWIVNSIVWDDRSAVVTSINGASIGGTNSYVKGGLDGEPEPADPLVVQGYRLAANSPCIDSAISSNLPPADINGDTPWDHPSIYNPPPATIQDVGADEFIDSDADSMDDSWEYAMFIDLTHNNVTDADVDGLTDLEEYDFSTHPLSINTDADAMSDYEEWVAGTRGNDADSIFEIASLTNSEAGLVLDWESVVGRTYSILSKTNLTDPLWVTNVPAIMGDGTRKSYTNGFTDSHGCIRLSVTKP